MVGDGGRELPVLHRDPFIGKKGGRVLALSAGNCMKQIDPIDIRCVIIGPTVWGERRRLVGGGGVGG